MAGVTGSAFPQIIAHVDLNSFFASVEQQANPLLRGKPLGVCAYLHRRGCVIAASIEAKRMGMKVGMTVAEASRAVPGAVFVQNDPPKYRAVSARVFTLLHELSQTVERYSIDEAFFDLTGWYRSQEEAAKAFVIMQRRVRAEIGEWLGCSVGIAPTRFLAKTASDLKKPDGLTIISPENLEERLSSLELEAVCGVGPRTRIRLEELGYRTLLDVKRAPVANLMRAFGKRGYFLWCNLNGIEVEGVAGEDAPPQSIGHSYCVPVTANQEGKVEGIAAKLTDRAARRLREQGMLAGVVSLIVGFRGPGYAAPSGPFWTPRQGEGGGEWMRLSEPADDVFTLVDTAITLLRRVWHGESVNFLAVALSELSEPNDQIRMTFDEQNESSLERRKRLSDAIDTVQNRHGDHSLRLGRLFHISTEDAPDRIGYRKL